MESYENCELMNCEVRMIHHETSSDKQAMQVEGGATDESKASDDVENMVKWYERAVDYFERMNSDMALRDPTLGDGNCFYHAVLDQINLLRVSSPS